MLSQNPQEVHNAVVLTMNCTIHLEGKKQAVFENNHEIIHVFSITNIYYCYLTQQRLIDLIEKTNDEDLRLNIKQTLINISDLPKGFQVITFHLCKNIKILEEVKNNKE